MAKAWDRPRLPAWLCPLLRYFPFNQRKETTIPFGKFVHGLSSIFVRDIYIEQKDDKLDIVMRWWPDEGNTFFNIDFLDDYNIAGDMDELELRIARARVTYAYMQQIDLSDTSLNEEDRMRYARRVVHAHAQLRKLMLEANPGGPGLPSNALLREARRLIGAKHRADQKAKRVPQGPSLG